MNRPSLVVLDVGHGNAAVLLDTGGVVVIDAGKGGILLDFLKQAGIKVVDLLLISHVSHADTDHVRNAPDLLLDKEIRVVRVCYNSDSSKQSRVWKHFRKAIKTARREKGLTAEPQLTTSQTGKLDRGSVHVEVLYPPPEMAGSGPGGTTEEGDPLTSNSMSAVVRLTTSQGPMVLLAGDVESSCLRTWHDDRVDPGARVLVFPHHGGNPDEGDAATFAAELARAVRPEVVIFSIHRSQYDLPRVDVVEAVRHTVPDVRVVCTQLSAHCVDPLPPGARTHLNEYPAHGKRENTCCAGTITIDLSKGPPELLPLADQHLQFIRALRGEPLCVRKVS
jgi:competence protein ComEC